MMYTRSPGTLAFNCIFVPPCRSPPKRSELKKTPIALVRPSNATPMASTAAKTMPVHWRSLRRAAQRSGPQLPVVGRYRRGPRRGSRTATSRRGCSCGSRSTSRRSCRGRWGGDACHARSGCVQRDARSYIFRSDTDTGIRIRDWEIYQSPDCTRE